MTPARNCIACKNLLESGDRFCTQCGQTTAQIQWSASLETRPGSGAVVLPATGAFYLVAHNTGEDSVRVRIDTTRLRGLHLVGHAEGRADSRQSLAFALRHLPEENIGGFVTLWSDDGPRLHPSAHEPQNPWWEVRASRQQRLRAEELVRVVADRWILGSPNLLFPPGVRKQYTRVWNDSEQARSFVAEVPAGYRITNVTLPIDKKPPQVFAQNQIELVVEAPLDHLAKTADRAWYADIEAEPIPLCRLPSATEQAGADVLIAIDFGTRNTGVRARWRHSLVEGKPKGTVDVIGDRNGHARFPSEMALHRNGRSFRWGSDVPRGLLAPDEIRIRNLKTLLRVNAEPYLQENPRWTNAYLLERYFEELFIRIDDYFKATDASLSRENLNVRYVLTRPVLDSNEADIQGKNYERALITALERCGVEPTQITFVQEPVAAAYGIAKRRAQELLAMGEGTPIAVIDAGGGTTDIAVGYVSLREGRVALDIRGAYALHLDTTNPALPAVERFGATDRHEFGGDVLDYALTYRLLTDAAPLLETEGRAVPPRLEVSATPLPDDERVRRESELVLSCRTMKEAFAHVSTHHLTRSATQAAREHEHFIFANRPEYEGIYLEQSLVGDHLIAPILTTPLQDLRERMEQDGFEEQGIRPSKVKHVFYVGGTNIEFYLRQQFQEAFPNSPRLQAEGQEGVEERIAERLNAVVEGAVWCEEALFAASPLTFTLTLDQVEKWRLPQGAPLPPESVPRVDRFLVQLEPFQEMDALLSASGGALPQPLPVARGFYRNTSETMQEGALQVRVSREKGVTATLVINNRSYEQWRVALAETV
jgi:molecular chaperone DnaK (HSP70)